MRLIKQVCSYYEDRYPGKVVPNAPFAIATFAYNGWNLSGGGLKVAQAQLPVDGDANNYPKFDGNVKTMEARGFWRPQSASPSADGSRFLLHLT